MCGSSSAGFEKVLLLKEITLNLLSCVLHVPGMGLIMYAPSVDREILPSLLLLLQHGTDY